jgi:hypothetical protein
MKALRTISRAADAEPENLTVETAEQLQQYGSNAGTHLGPRDVKTLLGTFWGVIPWMLELAILLDLVLGRWIGGLITNGAVPVQCSPNGVPANGEVCATAAVART